MDMSEMWGAGPGDPPDKKKRNLPTPLEFMNLVQELKGQYEAWVEMLSHVAKMRRAYYEALVKEGFTEAEALAIINTRGILEL